MSFYRPATLEDFGSYEVSLDGFRYMDDETKLLIEQGDIRKAMNDIRKKTGAGLANSKMYCMKYQAFVEAKRDFEQGKPVFVSY